MTTYHKPPEYLTVKEYIYDIAKIPFQCGDDGYIADLTGYEAVLRDVQDASHDMSRHYGRAKDSEDDFKMYRREKERHDLLHRQLEAMEAIIRARYGLDHEQIHRDVNLLRDKRSCGVI